MPSSFAAQSPADVINLALARLGFKLRVGSLYDGSAAAKKALDVYAQTRDVLLRDADYAWPFAERNVVATLLKQSPVGGYIPPNQWNPVNNPPLSWLFEYSFPSDCLEVRAVKPQTFFIPNFDPQPNLFAIINDNGFTPPQRAIVCNVAGAILTYVGQVTDPNQWPPDFTEALAANLARRLAPFVGGPEALKVEAADEQMSDAMAEAKQG